jgi:predicted translin family RNA/ssDNA-binding protein
MNTETLKLEEITKWGISFGTPETIEEMEEAIETLNEVDEKYEHVLANIRRWIEVLENNGFELNVNHFVDANFLSTEVEVTAMKNNIEFNLDELNSISGLADTIDNIKNLLEFANEDSDDVECMAYRYIMEDAIENYN